MALPVVLLLASFAAAQLRDRTEHQPIPEQKQPSQKQVKNAPRAIGVVEFLPGGGTRLVPIALWINDRFYDASLYAANPVPMAVEPETLYEAFSYGDPTGWFTVTTPAQLNGNWFAEGQWKPQMSMDAKIADQAARQPRKKPQAPSAMADDQGPPVLRRPGESGADTASSGGTQAAPGENAGGSSKGADDPDRPTLKSSPSASSNSTASQPSSSAAPSSAPASQQNNDDPDRPVLRRGVPPNTLPKNDAQPAAVSIASKTPPPASAAAAKPSAASNKAKQALRAYAAISDAGNHESRSMLYSITPAEREVYARLVLPTALDEIRKFIAQRKGAPLPPATTISDYELRIYDLDFSNSPTLVLMARLPTTAKNTGVELDYFATIVARLDLNGQPIKIYSAVTDSNHLDVYPRVEIIDALDADANGRGDLLFRQYSDTGLSYALYRVFPYQMVKVFEGGAGM